MNIYDKKLLALGLENFRKNGTSYSEIQPNDGQAIMDLTEAAKHLHENKWLEPHSDNILSDSFSVVPNETLICYNLTNEGLQKAKSLETA